MVLSTPTSAASSHVHNHLACSAQWATRPVSERFWSVQELRDYSKQQFDFSEELSVQNDDLLVACAPPKIDTSIECKGREKHDALDLLLFAGERSALLNHWSFGQLCTRLGAPANYFRTLPAEEATRLMNFELERHGGGKVMVWMNRGQSGSTALAFTSNKYRRIPSYEVCEALLSLPSEWRVPPARPSVADPRARPATANDILKGNKMGLSVKEGDLIAPAGVYGDDRSMFVFMVNEERPIEVSQQEILYRGFYVQNSEVGHSALAVTVFDYVTVCGNHIIWGCRNVQECRIRHIGERESVAGKFQEAFGKIREFSNADTSRERSWIAAVRSKTLGKDREAVVDFVHEKGILSRRMAEEAWDCAEAHCEIHGAPNTAWGFASGMTRLSQRSNYADVRNELDRSAHKVLALAGIWLN
jgi:hypothetical protein